MKKTENRGVLLLLFLSFLCIMQARGERDAETLKLAPSVRQLALNGEPSLSITQRFFLNRQEEGGVLPFRGFLPVELMVGNAGTEDRKLVLQVKEERSSREWDDIALLMDRAITRKASVAAIYEREMEVPAGTEKTFLFYVPLNELWLDLIEKRTLRYFIKDAKTGKVLTRHTLDGGKNRYLADCVGCMGELYRLKLLGKNKFGWFHLFSCDPGQLPADSRYYSSLDAFLMSMEDWERMDAAHCRALLEWVSAGGLLFVEGFQEGLGLERGNYGIGRIFKCSTGEGRNGLRLMYAGMISAVKKYKREEVCSRELRYDEDRDNELKMESGVAVYVLLFLLVAGPVNFIFFAPPGRRKRLLWTFPLTIMAGIAGFAVYLKFNNGIVGEGKRFALVQLCPDFDSAHILQAQISRNGLLWDGSFSLDEATSIRSSAKDVGPDAMKKQNSSHRVFAYGRSSPIWERIDGIKREGNLINGAFASHKVLFHLLEKSVPWTEQVFLEKERKGDIPFVSSTFSVTLTRFEYRDEKGRKWGTDSIPPGTKVPLQFISEKQDKEGEVEIRVSEKNSEWLWRLDPGCFHASAEAYQGVPVDTLPSIRWKDRVMFRGKVHKK